MISQGLPKVEQHPFIQVCNAHQAKQVSLSFTKSYHKNSKLFWRQNQHKNEASYRRKMNTWNGKGCVVYGSLWFTTAQFSSSKVGNLKHLGMVQ